MSGNQAVVGPGLLGEAESNRGRGGALGRLNGAVESCLALAAPTLLPAVKSVCFLKWVMMKWQRM